ncbi:tetratricopeptide repeat protein [Tepidibacter hydrothermalis]|uniref:Tetratricopeptide repeat protein n=1 Tax=Tepidibacter hydrothermalis TaxID=3036126 RepID=A0ABY8EKP0_9FIRM|nr:hypothetical protein [Tepidibacter hydrothermalis]WFD11820.1 hypothetical protein P4S50_07010 [Tepidibacter hydrothermalis]
MVLRRVILYPIIFIVTIIVSRSLEQMISNKVLSGIITLILVLGGYIYLCKKRKAKRFSLILDQCDPYKFLEATEKQRKITGKSKKYNVYFDMNKALGLSALGRFEETKEILENIDKSKLSRKDGTEIVYIISLISCYYDLGEIEKAEKLFESKMPILSPLTEKMRESVEFLLADRLFYLGRYEESKKIYEKKISDDNISKCIELEILYKLAQIDEKNGDLESAKSKYIKVSNEGNKLYIAEQSSFYLNR